jgi:hypothetical protein
MKNRPSVFISYPHADRDRVIPIASYLGRLGLQVWMDIKEMAAGQAIVEQVSKAIAKSDLYVVVLSPSALSSKWVNHELNTALTLEINHGRPRVLPVVISKAELPVSIQSRLYVDMAETLDAGKPALRKAVAQYLPDAGIQEKVEAEKGPPKLSLVSVALQLQSETSKYYGGAFGESHTKEEVQEEAVHQLKALRRRANGILLNFISADDMDFSSPQPKFPNGEMSEFTRDGTGEFVGTFNKEVVVEVEIVNPDEKKLNQLVSSKLESLGVSHAVYTFVVTPRLQGLPQRALNRLQKEYVILGWDPDQGVDVELPDDLKLSVACTEEKVRVGIETKYQFQFEERAKEFSVRQFVAWLVDQTNLDESPTTGSRRRGKPHA